MFPSHLPEEITRLLRQGDYERLAPLVHDELYRIAHQRLFRLQPGATLDTRAVISEFFLKLMGGIQVEYEDRNHFFALASQAMRYILINYIRDKYAEKRGAGAVHLSLDDLDGALLLEEKAGLLLELDEALDELAARNERQALVVQHRYFGGFTTDEIADMLTVSPRTVKRDWEAARLFLIRALTSD